MRLFDVKRNKEIETRSSKTNYWPLNISLHTNTEWNLDHISYQILLEMDSHIKRSGKLVKVYNDEEGKHIISTAT